MSDQLTTSAEALRLLFTEDIYLIKEKELRLNDQAVELEETLPVKPDRETGFDHLGKNQRNILILVNDPQNQVSTEQGRELLRKIVKAIDLTANDFALVNYTNYPETDFSELSNHFSSKIMFVFGVSAAQLGLPEILQNTLITHESTKLIFSSDLHSLSDNPQEKKMLWKSLQQLSI